MLRYVRSRFLTPSLSPATALNHTWASRTASKLPERARVALVGRTNVGKSTLFNRLTKSRRAIVHNVPGTTRDRRFAVGHLAGMEFDVIDTGGLADAPTGSLEQGMLAQTERALHEANLILFLVDGREGVTEIDKHFARWLRKADPKAPIHLVANKLEGDATRWLPNIHECHTLGMGDPLILSAEHGEGLPDLVPLIAPIVDEHEKALAMVQAAEENTDDVDLEMPKDDLDNRSIKLAIVGRPNVGKSTLLNKIVRDDRVLTGPEPGVTRDSVEVSWNFQGRDITLVDTAGIRKYSKRDHSNQIENLSVRDTYDAISSAQVVVVVVDVSEDHLIHLDLTIAQRVIDEGRALVLAANKSDLVENAVAEIERIRKELDGSLAQVRGVPVVPISALTGKGVRNILPEVVEAHNRWDLRVTTGRLNRWLAAMDRHHPPPTVKGKQLKIKYMTQVKARPPTFAVFVNRPEEVPETYRRFLLNQLRTEFDMTGVPARLLLRGGEDNPYKKGYARAKPLNRRAVKPMAKSDAPKKAPAEPEASRGRPETRAAPKPSPKPSTKASSKQTTKKHPGKLKAAKKSGKANMSMSSGLGRLPSKTKPLGKPLPRAASASPVRSGNAKPSAKPRAASASPVRSSAGARGRSAVGAKKEKSPRWSEKRKSAAKKPTGVRPRKG
ncbi:ras family GTPase [Achlya hypogyna]|uniref:GTPase Der n=1 Tax=Achlya hypogyna TaxID=1202772 RepID=A0A1V9YIW5_ACHHY|nr:ras family GTPase [Achlya hypogyna]